MTPEVRSAGRGWGGQRCPMRTRGPKGEEPNLARRWTLNVSQFPQSCLQARASRWGSRPGGQGSGPGPHYNLTGQSQAPHLLLFPCRGGWAQESEFKQLLPDPLKEATLSESSAVHLSDEHCASILSAG